MLPDDCITPGPMDGTAEAWADEYNNADGAVPMHPMHPLRLTLDEVATLRKMIKQHTPAQLIRLLSADEMPYGFVQCPLCGGLFDKTADRSDCPHTPRNADALSEMTVIAIVNRVIDGRAVYRLDNNDVDKLRVMIDEWTKQWRAAADRYFEKEFMGGGKPAPEQAGDCITPDEVKSWADALQVSPTALLCKVRGILAEAVAQPERAKRAEDDMRRWMTLLNKPTQKPGGVMNRDVVKPSVQAKRVWTGAAGDEDINNPANWLDAMPTGDKPTDEVP